MMTPMEEQPNDNGAGGGANRDSRPDPDPTRLTQALLRREIASIREILESKADGQNGIVNARFDGMDKAIRLLQTIADRMPEDVNSKVGGLRTLHDEKFQSIQVQFKERDTRVDQTSRDSKLAIDAALQAAKEAVGKSETSTIKQIDAQGLRIDDLKERLTRIEGEGRGEAAAKTTQQTSNTGTLGIIGAIVGALGLIMAFVIAIWKTAP